MMHQDRHRNGLIVAAIALLALVVCAVFDTRAAAAGWLFAVVMGLGLTSGSVCLLLAGRLTGGVWIETLAPPLAAMARLTPLAGIGFIPLLFAAPLLYPWAAHGAENASVGLYYLNWTFVLARLAVAFIGWSLIAYVVIALPGAVGEIAAGIGLIFHVVMTTFLVYDWVLALQPKFTSSVFGTHAIVLFMLSSLCVAALTTTLPDGKPARDVAGLMIASVLGSIYIGFMQFLIIWYGDLPDTVAFFLDRANALDISVIVAALVAGFTGLAMLLSSRARNSAARVRRAAWVLLLAVALTWGWTTLALFDAVTILTAVLGLVFMFAVLGLAARHTGGAVPRPFRHEERTS